MTKLRRLGPSAPLVRSFNRPSTTDILLESASSGLNFGFPSTIEDLVRSALDDLEEYTQEDKLNSLSGNEDYNLKRKIHDIQESLKTHIDLVTKIQREEGLSKLLDDDDV